MNGYRTDGGQSSDEQMNVERDPSYVLVMLVVSGEMKGQRGEAGPG